MEGARVAVPAGVLLVECVVNVCVVMVVKRWSGGGGEKTCDLLVDGSEGMVGGGAFRALPYTLWAAELELEVDLDEPVVVDGSVRETERACRTTTIGRILAGDGGDSGVSLFRFKFEGPSPFMFAPRLFLLDGITT